MGPPWSVVALRVPFQEQSHLHSFRSFAPRRGTAGGQLEVFWKRLGGDGFRENRMDEFGVSHQGAGVV